MATDEVVPEPLTETESERWMAELGRLVRESREGRFTLEELAKRAGVSGGLISQLERGIGNPSFNTLLRLSKALGLPISSMFHGHDAQPAQMVVRRDDRRELAVPREGLRHEILTPDNPRAKLGVVRSLLPAGYSNQDTPFVHPGEESLIIIEGTLLVAVGPQTFELSDGDTITFDSGIPHSMTNESKRDVELLACSTPPAAADVH